MKIVSKWVENILGKAIGSYFLQRFAFKFLKQVNTWLSVN